MYKSRDEEYQKRFEEAEPQSPYGYDDSRSTYQDDVYDEDDFYGQIMRSASRNKPYRNTQEEHYNDRYEDEYTQNRRHSRIDETGRMPRIEEEPHSRISYNERNTYHDSYRDPYHPEYTQPNRSYERTSQYSLPQEDLSRRQNYHYDSMRIAPRRRALIQESPYTTRDIQNTDYYQMEEAPPIRQRRKEPLASYAGYEENLQEERRSPMTLSEEYEAKLRQKKINNKTMRRKMDENTILESKDFVKNNLMIFLISLIYAFLFSLTISTFLYNQFLSEMVLPMDILKLCLLLTPLFAYLVAGLHCGYCMMKSSLKTMKTVFKVLLFPIFFLIYELLGFLCELPYLIYNIIKMSEE